MYIKEQEKDLKIIFFQKRISLTTEKIGVISEKRLLINKSTTCYNLFKEVEQIAIEFILRHYFQSNRRNKILHYITQCKKNVPLDLRIADTFFTHLTLHGKGELRDVSYETLHYKHVDIHMLSLLS